MKNKDYYVGTEWIDNRYQMVIFKDSNYIEHADVCDCSICKGLIK